MTAKSSKVDEPITITEYDPSGPAQFETERSSVENASGEVVRRIEHFGSTAVPGLAGKPIVDLLIAVNDLNRATQDSPSLEDLGYEYFGEIFIAGRIYLRRRSPHNLNVAMTVEGGEFWTAQLAGRDFLRALPEEAEAYSAHKRSMYAEGARLFSTFSRAKGPCLTALTERALRWYSSLRNTTEP